MRFQFRLQKMLTLASMKETLKKLEFSAEAHKLSVLENRKKHLEAEIESALDHKGRNLDIRMALLYSQRIGLTVDEIQKLDGTIETQKGVLDIRRSELMALTQKRRALESLRESKLQEFKVQGARKDQREIDEMYSLHGQWVKEK